MRSLELIIGGEQASGQIREIKSPHSGEPVSQVHFADADLVERAARTAERAAPVMRRLPIHERAAILTRISQLMRDRRAEVAAAIRDEAAKPWKLADGEAARCAETFQNAAEECKRLADGAGVGVDSMSAGDGRHGIIRRFPVGPVIGISPFNFPLNLSAHKLAPAIAAGCPMVLKPASQTPSAALLMGAMALEAGLPPEAISVVPAIRKHADALIEDQRFQLITFTGSPEVGWSLKARSGKKKVVLELGGNAAAVIGPDADLDWAAQRVAVGAFAYAGQICISVQRVIVHKSVFEPVVARLVEESRSGIRVGPPEDEEAIMSAMIDRENADRIMEWIEEAQQKGSKVLCGNEREGNVVLPTVLSEVDRTLRISAQEAFGPVVTVAPFDTWDEAIGMVNESRYGLQAAVFTNDVKAVWQCFNEIEVGGVIHNDYPTFRVDMMPYGGVKDSGFGREGPRWSVAEMTEERLLVLWPR
ncbi:aldehyde dehydrogenase family protein [Myxococcota bacterium]